jgi:hypothetical protein
MEITVTAERMVMDGYDEVAYEKFVTKNERYFLKTGLTPEEARASAESMGRIYRHQFRKYVPARKG